MERIKYLLSRYLVNQAGQEEIHEMLQWLRENGHNESLLQEVWEGQSSLAPAADLPRMWMNIEAATQPVRMVHFLRRNRWAVEIKKACEKNKET